MKNMAMIKEMWDFMMARKKWWLVPIMLFLLIISIFAVYIATSPVAPILYPLF